MLLFQRLVWFGFFWVCVSIADAQSNFHIRLYSTENGLPSNGIKGLQWDEQTGFLWIATEAGVARFNGLTFKSYTKENTSFIASERMLFLVRNIAGKIIGSDQAGNIFTINKNRLEPWEKNPDRKYYPSGFTYSIAVSDSLYHKKIMQHVGFSFSTTFDKILPANDTSCLVVQHGKIFFISLNSERIIATNTGPFTTGFKIGNENFFINQQKQVFLFDAVNEKLVPVSNAGIEMGSSGQSSLIIWEYGMGNPVLFNGKNAWSLSYHSGKLMAALICNQIPTDALVQNVQYSVKNNLLFLGTDSKGLIIISQNKVDPMKNKERGIQERNAYYAQVELANGNILTNEGHIIGNSTLPAGILPAKGHFSVTVSLINDTLMWFGQRDKNTGIYCLHSFNYHTGQTKIFIKIICSELVYVKQMNGGLYVATDKGIGKLADDSLIYLYKYAPENNRSIIYDFKEMQPGVFGIASCAGLFRFDVHTNTLDTLFKKEAYCVRTIWQYKEYSFVGTYGNGFYIIKKGIIKPMPLDKNKYLLYTHCFVPDDKGFCWISTNRGLFKASLDEMIAAWEKNSSQVYFHYFGRNDGMDMTEMNGGCVPCALMMKNKTISFPTMDGLLWVNPEKATPVLPEGDVYIDEVVVDNRTINPDSLQQLKLPAATAEILIRLSFSGWCNKENIYLEYQLNDTVKWKKIDMDNEAVIRFSNLAGGNYRLRIRKLNGFGFNNYSYRQLTFSILLPWQNQSWFYGLLSLAIVGFFILVYQLRTRQLMNNQRQLEMQVAEKTKELQQQNEVLEKNNTIKTRLISIISHDIVTPLKFLTVAGKNLLEKRKMMTEELQQETMQEITNTSQELQLLSTNILNWIKYQNENRRLAKEKFSVHELVTQVFGVLNSLAKQKKLLLVNQADKELMIYQFYEPLKILVYNLVSNAINFTEQGNISISSMVSGSNVIVSVHDEGVGMTPEQINNIMADQFIISSANIDKRKGNGLGYLIIKDLVKMMGATLHIESKKGAGTTVFINIPV